MTTLRSWFAEQWCRPTFSNLLKRRRIIFLLLIIVVIHLVLTKINVDFWQCPVKTFLGFRCPGCGLSHAILYLFHGKWRLAIIEHLFAPVFVLGFLIMIVVILLPLSYYQKVVTKIELLELRTGFFNVIMLCLVIYWISRMF